MSISDPAQTVAQGGLHDTTADPSGFELSPERVRNFQIAAIASLVLLSTAGQLALRWFESVPGVRFAATFVFVDGEQTIPALYSTVLLLVSAGLAAVVGWIFRPANDRFAWKLLAAVFAVAGLDEYAAIHERAIEPIREGLSISGGLFYYAWIIPGAAAVILLAVAFSGFLSRLPTDTRRKYVVAGMMFVIGAIGIEAISAGYVTGAFAEGDLGVDPDAARANLTYVLLTTVEEILEMAGVATFLTATVSHIKIHLGRKLVVGARSI